MLKPTLNRQQFMTKNKQKFSGLSSAEKNDKYNLYLTRRKVKQNQQNKIAPSNTYSTNAGRQNNPVRRRVPAPQGKQSTVKLSECLLRFARASIDPFYDSDDLPCIPDNLSLPSYKFYASVDTTMTVGTTGIGYVAMNPWTMACNDNGANVTSIDYPIVCTTGIYEQANYVNQPVLLSTQTLGTNSNSPYDVDFIGSGDIRLVAAGVEIMYIGQLLNQSGAVTVLQNDGLRDFPDQTSVATIRKNPRAVTCATSKDSRCYVTYCPTNTDVLSYKPLSNYRPSEEGVTGNFPLLIIVSGATPGITFQIRARSYFEAQLYNSSTTPSHADPIGFPAFQSARTMTKPTTNASADLKTTLSLTARNIASAVSGLAPFAGGALGTLAGNPAAGYAAGNVAKDLIESVFL